MDIIQKSKRDRRRSFQNYLTLLSFFALLCFAIRSNKEISSSQFISTSVSNSEAISDHPLDIKASHYCKSLITKPRPFNQECRFDWRIMECRGNGSVPGMFSQFRQDYYLYSRHFRYLNRKGVYADIATNHPIAISNTFFFDRCLGWSGLCVEANSIYFEPIFRERSCTLVPTCVGSSDGEFVEFSLSEGLGGIIGNTYKFKKSYGNLSESRGTTKLRCTTMERACKKFGLTKIDYLSLDVEGHELEVLKGLGIPDIQVQVMTIESSHRHYRKIDEYLTGVGYVRHYVDIDPPGRTPGLLHDDVVYLHKSVKFGAPV